jgi:DNA-directed RNA polymerase specialized sigma24 family protein
MGRSKINRELPSERQILRELASERRLTRQNELDERNRKIMKMVELGCDYTEIGGRYGLTRNSVRGIISRKLGGRGVSVIFGGSTNHERAKYMDGIG